MSECRVGIPEPTWERATLECRVPVLGARPVTKAAWPEREQSLPVLGAPKRPLWGDHASPSPSRGATAPEARTPCGAAEWTQGSGSSCSRRAARLLYSGKASPETRLSPDQQTVRRQLSTGGAGIPFNDDRTSTGDWKRRHSFAAVVWGARVRGETLRPPRQCRRRTHASRNRRCRSCKRRRFSCSNNSFSRVSVQLKGGDFIEERWL